MARVNFQIVVNEGNERVINSQTQAAKFQASKTSARHVTLRISSVFLYFGLHVDTWPTAAERFIKQHGIGQNQLMVGE